MLTTKDWGQEGGNQVRAEFRAQGPTPNLPLNIEVNGKLIEAFLATDANGAPSSTAAAGRRGDQRQAGGRRAA